MDQNNNITDDRINCEDLAFMFRRVAQLMHRGHHHHGEKMRPAQVHVLFMLKDKAFVTQKELMDWLAIRSGSLSELLAKLEQQGFIVRMRDERDKRGFVVMITDQGKALVCEYEQRRREKTESLFSALSVEERRQLLGILSKLAVAWENDPHEAHDRCEKKHARHGRCAFRGHGFGHRGHGEGRGDRGGQGHHFEPSGDKKNREDCAQ